MARGELRGGLGGGAAGQMEELLFVEQPCCFASSCDGGWLRRGPAIENKKGKNRLVE